MSIAQLLPMAFVMIAGPQILTAIFLATSENWRVNSAAFLVGAALSITIIVSIAYVVGVGLSEAGAADGLYIVVIVLLVAAGVHVFRTRKTAEPPRWMGRLQGATPRTAFVLGFLLLGVFPTDILTSWAVGTYLSNNDEPWWQYIFFVLLTLLLLALPVGLVLALGERGRVLLPKVRDWMNANSWIISEVVIGLFIAIAANSLAD
jgi:threonine/homoserine/homoserine lactone efflux protein